MIEVKFSPYEVLLILGGVQCLYVSLYMFFKAGKIAHALIPSGLFLILSLAFTYDVLSQHFELSHKIKISLQWALWFYLPQMSTLLIIQLGRLTRLPEIRTFLILLLIPVSFCVAYTCYRLTERYDLNDWLLVAGVISGALSLLTIWAQKDIFNNIVSQRSGRQRYWVVITIVIMNSLFLCVSLLSINGSFLDPERYLVVRALIGLCLAYLVGTGLFRIYPQALRMRTVKIAEQDISAHEQDIINQVARLLDYEKVYQEASYSRGDLARECGVSELQISKIVNDHFHKSVPQLLNERRVEEAKKLLKETSAPISVIATEAGFNSLATFNRVFKAITDNSPSSFRH